MIADDEQGGGLGDLVATVLRRRWLPVAGALAAAVVSIGLVALQSPVYRAEARVLIDTQPDTAFGTQAVPAANAQRAVQTELQVIASTEVAREVQAMLGLDALPPAVEVSAVGQTDVVALRVRAGDPTTARHLADAYTLAYIEVSRSRDVAILQQARDEVQRSVDGLDAIVDDLEARAATASETAKPRLEEELQAALTQQAELQRRLAELDVDISLQDGGGEVVRAANAPASPLEPTPIPTVGLATLLGALVGVLGAVAVARLDRGLTTTAELEAAAGVPVLASLPTVEAPDHRPLVLSRPDDPFAEQVRTLRAGVGFVSLDHPLGAVLFTSAMPGDGKTTVAANYAVAAAETGKRVLLLDADLRKPRVAHVFGIAGHVGLAEVLLGTAAENAVVEISPTLSVLPAGSRPPNPSGLFAGARFEMLMSVLRARYDLVVMDSPPVLPVTDTLALAAATDGVILVARVGQTEPEMVRAAAERLALARGRLLGTVLNGVDRRDAARLYGYGYGSDVTEG